MQVNPIDFPNSMKHENSHDPAYFRSLLSHEPLPEYAMSVTNPAKPHHTKIC
jgi:hypothetical protein